MFDVQIMSGFSAFHVQVKKYWTKFADQYFQKQLISLAVNWWKIKTCNDNSNSAPIALLNSGILNYDCLLLLYSQSKELDFSFDLMFKSYVFVCKLNLSGKKPAMIDLAHLVYIYGFKSRSL